MAEPYQPINVNTGSAQQAIQATPNVTPNLEGLMENIKSGFISADDIRRRVADGPLEAATRQQNLADVQQVRPLQRQAAVAELENVQAKQEFEAQTLPILNSVKRANLEQAHQNALQFGAPDEILKVFYASVPGFIPYDEDKLHDKKTGQVNIPYANEQIIKAKQAAAKMAATSKFVGPVKQSTTDASGKMTETTTVMDQISGQPVGAPITTETKEAATSTNTKEAKSTRFNPATGEEEDIVQRYDSANGSLIGEPIVVGKRPVKLTQEQANALQFSSRMDLNNQVVADLETQGFDPTAFKTTVQKYLFNRWKPEALQSYTAAKDNWITAALRKESGAAISASEYKQANREYFPQDGDSPAVVKQKQALRDLAEENIRISAGSVSQVARPSAGAGGGAIEGQGAGAIPTVNSVAEANALPASVQFFRTPSGQTKVNKNYRASGAAATTPGNLADLSIEELKNVPIEGLGGRSLADLSIEELKKISITP